MSDRQQALDYVESHFEEFVETLKDLVRIPSVSFAGFPPEKVVESAEAVMACCEKAGLEKVQLLELPGVHPYVYAEKCVHKDKPTLLLYAHHDVQPPMREELWESAPFEPDLRGDRLYGRGAADDKAGFVVHLASALAFLETSGDIPVNIKLLIEGEEEIGSPNLSAFMSQYANLLACDLVILTDLQNYDTGVPSLTTSLRGLVVTDVEVRSLDAPLHSGMWGGPVPDPVMALSKMLAGLSDDEGKINITGIYDDCIAPTTLERQSMESLGYEETDFRKQTGMLPGTEVVGGDYLLPEKMWRLPSLVIHAIQAGDRKNAGNAILDSAWARIGIRIVPGMDPQKVQRMLQERLQELAPWGVDVTFECHSAVSAWMTQTDHPVFETALATLSEGYGERSVLIGCGGTIPFVGPITKALGNIPALLVGIEDPYTKAHSENESLYVPDLKSAILSQIHLFDVLAQGV